MNEHEDMVDTCISHRGALTEWEETFIDDMAKKLSEHRELTEKQAEHLEKIHTKCVRRRR